MTYCEFDEAFQDALAREGLCLPAVRAELSEHPDGGVSFDLIRVQEKRKGIGDRVLQILTGLADAHGVTLFVIPARVDDDPNALTDEQLEAWYRKNRFVTRLMRRDPRPPGGPA